MRLTPVYIQRAAHPYFDYEFKKAEVELTLCNLQEITRCKYDILYDKLIVERDMELYNALITTFRGTGNPTLDALYLRLKMFKDKIHTVDLQSEETRVLVDDLLNSIYIGLSKLLNCTSTFMHLIKADYIKPEFTALNSEDDYYSYIPSFRVYEHTTDEGIIDWGIYASPHYLHINLRTDEYTIQDIKPVEQIPEFVYVVEEEIEKMGVTAVEVLSYLRDNENDYGSMLVSMFFKYDSDVKVDNPELLKYSPMVTKGEEIVEIPDHYIRLYNDIVSTSSKNFICYRDGVDEMNRTLYLHRAWEVVGRFIPSITTNRVRAGFVRYLYKVYNTEEEARATGGTVKKILKTDYRVNLGGSDFMFHYTLQRLFEV